MKLGACSGYWVGLSRSSSFTAALVALLLAGTQSALAQPVSGALRVELITAYNLVVDSNAGTPSSNAPRSGYMGATFHNDGTVPLTDVIARIGDYKGGTGDTPGVYPTRIHAGLTGPLTGGAFALTHEGGSAGLADATRYVSAIPPGGSVTIYWLVDYPQLDVNGVPTWGKSIKPEDDLWLQYDVWATAVEGGTPRAVDTTRTVTMRNEISASANKIYPNGANKVPDYYKDLMNQYVPAWTNANADGTVGTRIITEGIWYDLGNVGEGFDNNGDLVPDHNAWMQPVGNPAIFDAGAFRLMHTYAMVIVKLKTGGEQVLFGEDQLYFENIPDNNGAVGYVRYEFMPLLPGARSMTSPYQEVASGRDNEKFNADYGVSLGESLISGEAKVLIDKTANVTSVAAGGTISYTVAYTNSGTAEIGRPGAGVPLVVQDAVPAGTVYVAGSATANNTLPSGVSSYHVLYSADGGVTWTLTQPAASTVTHIQWWLDDPLLAAAAGAIRFAVTVANPYTQPSPLITNVAGLSLGNTTPFVTDSTTTLVTGNNSVGDTVYADTGVGTGGYLGNGIQDGAEPGISGITVWLYRDLNSNGSVDAGEPRVGTTETGVNGAYLFGSLADGRYVVVVDQADSTLTYGYTVTTVGSHAVDLDSARATTSAVNVLTADFGFAPALVLGKMRVGSGTLREGQNVVYALSVTNRLAGDGSGVGKPTKHRIWAKSGTSGTSNKAWLTPANAYHAFEPDGQYATAPMKAAGEWLELASMSTGPQLGSVATVRVVVPIRVILPFDDPDYIEFSVLDNGTAIAGTTFRTNANQLAVGAYELSFNVTSARAWTWSSFAPGNTLSVRLLTDGKNVAAGVIEVDSAAFELTSTAVSGASSGTTTLDPVPLDDFFDPTRLRFVSSLPAADTVTTNAGVGRLHWNNVGPIYAGGVSALSATFTVLQPPGNVATPLTNTASVTQATFLSGRPANQDLRKVVDNVLPAGTIGDFVWRDLDGDGVQDAGEPGVAGVTVSITPPAGVDLGYGAGVASNVVTDANGYYLFRALPATGNYTVAVVASTLPGGTGTPTWDRDGIGTPNSAIVNIVYNSTTGADTVLNADFGYTLPSTIRGTLWHDLDRDALAVPESGEDRLAGVTVRLYAANGTTLLATTTTAADGTYVFTGAYSGSYVVKADAATGPLATGTWTRSFDTDGLGTANEVTVSVASGGVAYADYSYYLTGSYTVGDTLFYDWDGDGTQDAGVDTGIGAVTVRLYQDENLDGLVTAGVDASVAVTQTSAAGFYQFSALPAGNYLVVVDEADADFPLRVIPTYDPQGAMDGRSSFTLSASRSDQDFGYKPYGFNTIGDTVWFDANADGAQSGATETGIANVTVRLYTDLDRDGTYSQIGTAVTDANGKYLFSDLPDGAYRVIVDAASAGLPTDTFGHAYYPTTVTSRDISATGGNYLNADFGFAPLGAIGDTIFWDNNANGGQDWSEPGIAGVTVRLYRDANANGVYDTGETLVDSKVTDANGKYLFTGLAQGRYVVVVNGASAPLAGATLRADPEMDGAPCPTPPVSGPTCDGQTGVSILPGTSYMGADFGYQPPGTIGDTLWIDSDSDGVRDVGEQPIPYVTVAVYSGVTLVATNVTDADGYYSFGGLADGTYRVDVVTTDADFPAGVTATFDADGTPNGVANAVVISGGHVTSIGGTPVSNADMTIDFGYRYSGSNSLSGTVGLDVPTYDGLLNGMNASGVGAGEYPFADLTVYVKLWNDDGDNVIEAGETTEIGSTATAANGDYAFTGLPNGDGNDRYVVSLTAPAGDLKLTTQTGNTPATLVHNTTNTLGIALSAYQVMDVAASRNNIDFAFRSATLRDYGDLPATYSTTVADQPVGPSHAIVTGQNLWLGSGVDTELNGQPSANATGDGADEDGVVAVGNWQVGDNGGRVNVTVGAGSGWLVGWVDFNQDGTFTNANERVFSQAVTSGGTGIVYAVNFDIPAGTFRTDGPTYLNARFRLFPSEPLVPLFSGAASAGEVEDYRFAFGIIGNRVWHDADGNGIQDVGETGATNVTVRLYGATSNLLQTVTTDAAGGYTFVGLATNRYFVRFAAPAAYTVTRPDAGADDTVDSDAAANGWTGAVTLSAGGDRRDIDAGLVQLARVYGYSFIDANVNLYRNVGDIPVATMIVYLWQGSAAVATANTDVNGFYEFNDVMPGAYEVRFVCNTNALIRVPTSGAASINPERNRTAPSGGFGVATVTVMSGDGVVPGQGEPINAGFGRGTNPMAAAIDLRAYRAAEGVVVEFMTIEEQNAGVPMFLYALVDGQWIKVGEVVSRGEEGSYLYRVTVKGLSSANYQAFRILDDEGQYHTLYSVPVGSFETQMVRMTKEGVTLTWDSLPGTVYEIRRAASLAGPWDTVKTVPAVAYGSRTTAFAPADPMASAGFFQIRAVPLP